MRKIVKMSVACAMMMGVSSVSAQAADGVSILDDVKFNGQLRPRVQYTDDSSTAAKDAGNTFTNRTNLSVNAALLGVDGLRTTVELNSVNDFGTLDKPSVDLAAEAPVAKVTQANITYGIGDAVAVAGRMTTNLDNQRFIGSVGWKQNFQTLDLVGVVSRGKALEYTVAYVYGVSAIADAGNGRRNDSTNNAVYGGGKTSGETKSLAINASYKVSDEVKVTAYSYMLGSHSDTKGAALSGNIALSDGMKIKYRGEYAMQSDATLETSDLGKPKSDATYMNACASINLNGLILGAHYEVLSGTDGTGTATAFSTPLATKHKFNGWADKFLTTPTTGLVDTSVIVAYKTKEYGVAKVVYHKYASDVNDISYGSELNLLYKTKVPSMNNVTGMIKVAKFTEGDSATDGNTAAGNLTKVWLMADYKFSI